MLVLAALALAAACTSGSTAFTLGDAVAESAHLCAAGARNAPYPLRMSVAAHNPTSSAVVIKSVTASLKLEAEKGPWLEKIGDVYDAGAATFTPSSIAAGSDRSLEVTVTSACTGAQSLGAAAAYGDYLVTLRVETSAGIFTVSSRNRHRIVA